MGFANEYLYTGRRLDAQTGLFYFRYRYYGAVIGRFINRDPIEYRGSKGNLYCYVDGSPVAYVDPLGLVSIPQALRACASEPTFVLKVKCICTLLPPDGKTCKSLTSCKKHLENLEDAVNRLRTLYDDLSKAGGKKARAIKEEIDDLVNAKNGIKGHIKETISKWGREESSKSGYPTNVRDRMRSIVEGEKQLERYLDKVIKAADKASKKK